MNCITCLHVLINLYTVQPFNMHKLKHEHIGIIYSIEKEDLNLDLKPLLHNKGLSFIPCEQMN